MTAPTFDSLARNTRATRNSAKNKVVSIVRDPFARVEIIRRTVETHESCAWCGQRRNRKTLFQYGIENDNGGQVWSVHVFCSISCWRVFYPMGEN